LHDPFEQETLPWAFVHWCPQVPQLFTVVLRFVSQPSSCLLALQSAQPAAQAPSQRLPVQCGVAWLAEQAIPQPPQLPPARPGPPR